MKISRAIDKIGTTDSFIWERSSLSTVLTSLPVAGILFKTLLFWAFLFGDNYYEPDFVAGISNGFSTLFVTLSILTLIYSCVFLFKAKKERFIYLLIFDLIYTFAAFVYICYLRFFSDVPSIVMLKTVFAKNGSAPEKASDFMLPVVWDDLLFFVDFLAMSLISPCALIKSRFSYRTVFAADPVEKWNVRTERAALQRKMSFVATAVISIICVGVVPLSGISGNNNLYANSYGAPAISQKVAALSPLGMLAGDIGSVVFNRNGLTEAKTDYIDEYFEWNKKNYAENAYTGAATGKNLLFIQLESFESFIIGREIEGQEITPNLNRLLSKSYYFSNMRDRASTGNSSDCDFMIQTSLALASGVAAFKLYADNKYNSMPQLLKYHGYQTAYYNGVDHSFWNYDAMMENGIKFEGADYDFDRSVKINTYISDESLLSQALDKMLARGFGSGNTPFYAHVTLNNSHAPFVMPDDILAKHGLRITGAVANTPVGDYFQAVHYTDWAVGQFLTEAEECGLLENTVVAIIGDHRGLHKYYPHVINELPDAVYLDWFGRGGDAGVPFILYDYGMEEGEGVVIGTYGTQLDVMPTVMDLFGIPHGEYAETAMGRSLFSEVLNATVDSYGVLYGEFSAEDKEALLSTFTVADLICRTDYFRAKNLRFVYED